MKTTDFYYDSADQRHLIYAKIWEPEVQPVGILQFLHGTYEHSGKYDEAAEYFTAHGYMCASCDYLGHGKTAAGDFGFFGYNHGAEYLLKDITHLTNELVEYKLPLFYLGFSMGSFLTQILISHEDTARYLSGAILAGSPGPVEKIDQMLERSKTILRREGPKAINREQIHDVFKRFEYDFPSSQGRLSWLTSIKGRQKKYEEDPYAQFVLTNAAVRDFLSLLKTSQEKATIDSTDPRLPLLFISGKDDPVGGFGKGLRELVTRYIDSRCDDLTLRIFPKIRHDVLYDFPATQNKALPFITGWMDQRR